MGIFVYKAHQKYAERLEKNKEKLINKKEQTRAILSFRECSHYIMEVNI